MSFHVPEKYAVIHPALGAPHGNNGWYVIDGPCGEVLRCQASDGLGWEHVSVSRSRFNRVPNWEEMCFVKNLFWDEEDCVVQFHPPKSEYVDNAPVLHLWRKTGENFELPHSSLVGIKNPK